MGTHRAAQDPDREFREAGVDLVDVDAPQERRSSPEKFVLGVITTLGLVVGVVALVAGVSSGDLSMMTFGSAAFGAGFMAALVWLAVGALRAD